MASDSEQTEASDSRTDSDTNPVKPLPEKDDELTIAANQEGADQRSGSDNITTPTFKDRLKQYQDELESEFQDYSKKLEHDGYTSQLSDLDWEAFEEKFNTEMTEKIGNEEEIMKEISTTFQQLMLWMRVSSEREAERARKRLRTRIVKVQMTERDLQQKREHEKQIRQAFEAAFNLLNTVA